MILFRPSLKLISISGDYAQYTFFTVAFLILFQKVGLIIFTLYYFNLDNSQKIINQAQDSFFLKLFCYYLNFY